MGRQQKKSSGFLQQGAILAAASIIVRIIGLVYRIPLTNIIGNEGNGFYSCAFEVYNIALLLSSYSLPLAVSKLVSARVAKGERKNAYRVFKGAMIFAISVGFVIGLIVFFGAGVIAEHVMTLPLSAYALRVLAPCLFIVAVMGVMRGYFQGLGTTMPTAISQVLEQIVNAIVSIAAASYLFKVGAKLAKTKNIDSLGAAYGAAGGTLGTVMGALTAFIFMIFVFLVYKKILNRQMKRDMNHRTEGYEKVFKVLLLTILPVVMSTAVYNISSVIDQGVFNKIMAIQGSTQNEYAALWGIYSGKYRVLINVPLGVANALAASVIPSLTAAVTSGARKEVHNKIHLAVRFAMIIAIPSFVGFTVLASPILQLLFSDAHKTPAYVMMIGAISVVFYCLSTITNAILQGINHMTAPIHNAAKALVIHLVALLIMLIAFRWNIYAVVVANVIFSGIMCFLNEKEIRRAVGYRQEIKQTFVLPGIAAVIMGICSYVFYLLFDAIMGGKVAIILALFIALVSYGISLLLLGGLSEDEIMALPKGTLIARYLRKLHLLRSNEE